MNQNSIDLLKKAREQLQQLNNQQSNFVMPPFQPFTALPPFPILNNTINSGNSLPKPLNSIPIPNIGTSNVGNLDKQTNIGWKVSKLNFELNEKNSINLSIKLENSTIDEIDKQKIKSALDSIKFIEKLIVDNGSVEKDKNKNVEKQQNKTNNILNDSNNQQNLPKIDKNLEQNNNFLNKIQQIVPRFDKNLQNELQLQHLETSKLMNEMIKKQLKAMETRVEQNQSAIKNQPTLPKPQIVQNVEQHELRIKQLETKIKELTDNKSEQTMEMQIGQIKSDYKKEIEILKKEFEENISDLNSKFSGLLQENNKQNKDEEKINIEKFNDQNKLLIIGQICKKEIEDLKKESQEKIQKEISDINSKFSALLLESNKKNEEENKINNEKLRIIGQILKKEIEDSKNESQKKIEKEISDLNSKFSILFSENKQNEEVNKINNEKLNEQNEFRIKQLETKIKELVDNGKTSEHAINYFKSMSMLINKMQLNHNKEIENLKKEFQENISNLNSNIAAFIPDNKEDKINDEEIDEFMKNYVLHNPNPTEEEKLRIAARILCVSIDKIDKWLENHQKEQKIKENDCNSSLEIINDFDVLDDEHEEEENGNEEIDETEKKEEE